MVGGYVHFKGGCRSVININNDDDERNGEILVLISHMRAHALYIAAIPPLIKYTGRVG